MFRILFVDFGFPAPGFPAVFEITCWDGLCVFHLRNKSFGTHSVYLRRDASWPVCVRAKHGAIRSFPVSFRLFPFGIANAGKKLCVIELFSVSSGLFASGLPSFSPKPYVCRLYLSGIWMGLIWFMFVSSKLRHVWLGLFALWSGMVRLVAVGLGPCRRGTSDVGKESWSLRFCVFGFGFHASGAIDALTKSWPIGLLLFCLELCMLRFAAVRCRFRPSRTAPFTAKPQQA